MSKKPHRPRLKASFAAALFGFFGIGAMEIIPENARDATYTSRQEDSTRHDYNIRPSDQFWKATFTLQRDSLESQLSQAAKDGDTWRMRILLDKGADMNADDGSMLADAALRGHDDVVILILDKTGDPDWVAGSAALRNAVAGGHLTTTELLLTRGRVNPNAGDALSEAVRRGDSEMVDMLLSLGADPSKTGFEALFVAIETRNDEATMMMDFDPGLDVRKRAIKLAEEKENHFAALFVRSSTKADTPEPPPHP